LSAAWEFVWITTTTVDNSVQNEIVISREKVNEASKRLVTDFSSSEIVTIYWGISN